MKIALIPFIFLAIQTCAQFEFTYEDYTFDAAEDQVYISVKDSTYKVLLNEEIIFPEIFAYGETYDQLWVKTSPIEESEDWCQLYDLDGSWYPVLRSELNVPKEGFPCPLSFEDGNYTLYQSFQGSIVYDSIGNEVYNSFHIIDLQPNLFLIDVEFEYAELLGSSIECYMAQSLFNSDTEEELNMTGYRVIHVEKDKVLLVDSEGKLALLNTTDFSFSNWYSEIEFTEILKYSPEYMYYDKDLESTSDSIYLSYAFLSSLQANSMENDFSMPFQNVDLYPTELNENFWNYRCYSSPGSEFDLNSTYNTKGFRSGMIDMMFCEYTGGPVMCYTEHKFINLLIEKNRLKPLHINDIIMEKYLDKLDHRLQVKIESNADFYEDSEYNYFESCINNFVISEEGLVFYYSQNSLEFYEEQYLLDATFTWKELKPFIRNDFKKRWGR